MILLVSGSTRSVRRWSAEFPGRLGALLTPDSGNSAGATLAAGLPFACDNAAFSGFDAARFRRLLRRVWCLPRCLFVACPDVVADARATLAMFREWRDEVAAAGHPVAFVGQDGAEDLDLPWGDIGAWFVGGSTGWKLSRASAGLMGEARRRGKHVHVGRVNSLRRLAWCREHGADSVDGTSASMFGDVWIPRYCRWLEALDAQPVMF